LETFLYVVASVIVSLLAAMAAILSTSQHREARNKAGGLIIGGGAFWVLASGLEVSTPDLSTKLIFARLHFVGVILVTVSWLVLALLVTGHERLVNRKTIALLSIVPLITLLLAFTNQSQNFFGVIFTLNSVSPFYPLSLNEGPGFWLLDTAYSYVLLLTGMVIILRRISAARRLYRIQALPMVILALIPFMLNVTYHYNPSWFLYIDPTPITLTVAATMLVWRLIYMSRLDVIPVAYEIVIDNLLESLIILDAGNRIVDLNPRALNLIGRPMSETIGRPIQGMWADWEILSKAIVTGAEKEKEVTLYRENDRRVYEFHCSNIEGATNLPYRLITLRDVTERKLVDERLREAARMAAIGETATMVAHDLRNPLQGISGAAFVLKQRWGPTRDSETAEMLDVIDSSLGYADNIVRDLMDYSKEVHLEFAETTAKAVTEAALLQTKTPENVRVRNLIRDTPRVMIDAPKMQRVFVNLTRNAIEAMPRGGELTLSSSELKGVLEVKIADTGEGIADSAMKSLWKPFKTTKTKGTGLGLVICKRIVEAHGGTIRAESAIRKGSTFTVTIPINHGSGELATRKCAQEEVVN